MSASHALKDLVRQFIAYIGPEEWYYIDSGSPESKVIDPPADSSCVVTDEQGNASCRIYVMLPKASGAIRFAVRSAGDTFVVSIDDNAKGNVYRFGNSFGCDMSVFEDARVAFVNRKVS